MGDDAETPVSTVFEFQRRTIESSQEALERSITFQQQLNEALLDGGLETSDRGAELTRRTVEGQLDLIEETVPGASTGVEQVRGALDEQFSLVEDAGVAAADAGRPGHESAADLQEQYLDTVDEHLEMVLAAHQEVRTQTLSFLDQAEAQLDELREQAEPDVGEQAETLQRRIETLRAQFDT